MDIQILIRDVEPIEPETLDALFPSLKEIDREKIYILKLILQTRAVHEDMDVFENAVLVLNGIVPDVGKMEGANPEYIWKALNIITKLRPDIEFSHEVKMYIKSMFTTRGLRFFPTNIDIDNPMFNEVKERAAMPLLGIIRNGLDHLDIQAIHYRKIKHYLDTEGEL